MSISHECPGKRCKHTKRIIPGCITVEIRQFIPSPPSSRNQSHLRTECFQCELEEKEEARKRRIYSYYKDLKISQSKMHTPSNYQELQSNLAMILPVSFGLAVVEKQDGSQILPWETFAIQDGDTIIVREIRPPKECDKTYQNFEWEKVVYEKFPSKTTL